MRSFSVEKKNKEVISANDDRNFRQVLFLSNKIYFETLTLFLKINPFSFFCCCEI